jgi:hypothetical protein
VVVPQFKTKKALKEFVRSLPAWLRLTGALSFIDKKQHQLRECLEFISSRLAALQAVPAAAVPAIAAADSAPALSGEAF